MSHIHENAAATLVRWIVENGFTSSSSLCLSSLSFDRKVVARDISLSFDREGRAIVKVPFERALDYALGQKLSVSGRSKCGRKKFLAQGLLFSRSSNFIEVALNGWSFLRTDYRQRENLWVSALHLPRSLPLRGNLSVFSSRTVVLGQHFFQGAYDYYLIRHPQYKNDSKRWLLVFSTGSKLPVPDRLSRDALILQYVLESRGLFEVLHHVSPRGRTLGYIGWSSGTCEPPNTHLLPPTHANDVGWWRAELFRRLSAVERSHPKTVVLPLEMYLESIHGSFGGATLKVVVALEAVCQWHAKKTPQLAHNRLVVASQPAWNQWVKTLKDDIQSFAATPSDRKTLFNRVCGAAGDDKGVVVRCFTHWGMWRNYMLECIQIRNALAHYGRLNRRKRRDITNTARKRALLARTMFNCALAKMVSFGGPVLDMRVLLRGGRPIPLSKTRSPPWWTEDEDAPPEATLHHQIRHLPARRTHKK